MPNPVDPTTHRELLSWRPDLAEPIDAPPMLVAALRVPCRCGRTFLGTRYIFFNNSLFICGECSGCGPASAILAPPTEQTQTGLVREIRYTEAEEQAIADVRALLEANAADAA